MHTPACLDYREIYGLSLEFIDPGGAEWAMRRNLKSKIRHKENIILRDQLNSLRAVGTNEVQCLALKMCSKIRYEKMMQLIKLWIIWLLIHIEANQSCQRLFLLDSDFR